MTFRPSPEQAAVAAYPLRPLRVTAGAGTGKTTTMAYRLASLIERENIAPEEALGITFTNKAAEELAERLRDHLSAYARQGREVEVATYHGFAFGLLAEFGALVQVERNAGVIGPGYVRQLLRQALGAEPHTAIDLTKPGAAVDQLAALASRLGDHLITPDDLLQQPEDDETGARRTEMAAALALYARRKAELGLLDYSDMICRAHRLLRDHPEVATRVRERYRVVLLDEYQDTNPAQRELLRLLFGGGFPVTAVGDPDQTIYEWRGASLENFAAFPQHFAGEDGTEAATLTLTHNRRSATHIIDLANLVRDQISRPSGLGRLQPLQDAPRGEVKTGWFPDAVQEARWIAREIRERHDEGAAKWSDMAILFRRHHDIPLVREALAEQDIPVEVASLGGLLTVPEVADLHAWLRVLGRPQDDAALCRLLLQGRFRLGLGDLAPLARRREEDGLGDDGPRRGLVEAADRLEECTGLSPEAERRLRRFRSDYRTLLTAAQGSSLVALCRRILDQTGAWPEIESLEPAARLSARLNIYRFLDLAEAWSPLEGVPSLEAFLDYLDLLSDEGAADELDTARVSGEDAVVLLTVHRAKGLEWPLVVLPALGRGVFPGKARTHDDPLVQAHSIPESLRLDHDSACLPDDPTERKAELQRRHDDQEWRTAYVAVTRAKQHLLLTGAFWYGGKKAREPSPLFGLAGTARATPAVVTLEAGPAPTTLRIAPTAPDPDTCLPQGWRVALRAALGDPDVPRRIAASLRATTAFRRARQEVAGVLRDLPGEPPPPAPQPFRTNVTGLVTFASCPRRFHWSAVDRLPRQPSPARQIGLDLHRRIEQHNRGAIPLDEPDEALYDLPGRGEGGREGGFALFRRSRFATRRPAVVEAPFELALDDARLAGRIDAVYADDGACEVVDFKSGQHRADPSLRVQLEAYAVAVAEVGILPVPPTELSVTFVYLGGGRLEEVSERADEQWLGEARGHLRALAARAAAGERAATPSDACRECDFTRFCPEGRAHLARPADPAPPAPRARR